MGVTISATPHQVINETNYIITLTGNETHEISTTVTSHPGVARDWLYSILYSHRYHRHHLIVGLGVQWSPYGYCSYNQPDAATIQLCIGRRCLIFQLHHADSCPMILRRMLSDPQITFVGLWNSQDAAKLRESRHRLEMESGMPIDLRHHAEDDDGRSLYRATIAEIAEEVLGIDIERSDEVAMSDWEDEDLNYDQVQQAAVDAFVAYAVSMRVRAAGIH